MAQGTIGYYVADLDPSDNEIVNDVDCTEAPAQGKCYYDF